MAKTRLTTGREANPNVAAKLAGSNRQSTGGGPINIAPKVTSPPLGGPSTNPKQDKNRGNRIAAALGRASAAVIGDPTHPFAQIGNLIAGEAEQDIFSSTVSDLLEGKHIKDVDTRGLSPEQISEALRLQKEGKATELGTSKERLSQLKQIADLEGLTPSERRALSRDVFISAGIPVDEEAIDAAGSLKSQGQVQSELLAQEGEQARFAQYQGFQQDIKLIREKGGLEKELQNLRNNSALDVAAVGAVSRLLGIQLDVAGEIAANEARYGTDPLFMPKLGAALQYMERLNSGSIQLSPDELDAKFVDMLSVLGLDDMAKNLGAKANVSTVTDEFTEFATKANVTIPTRTEEVEDKKPAKVQAKKEEKKKEPTPKAKTKTKDSNRAKASFVGIAPGIRNIDLSTIDLAKKNPSPKLGGTR